MQLPKISACKLGSFGGKQQELALSNFSEKEIYWNSVRGATDHEPLPGWVQTGEANRGVFLGPVSLFRGVNSRENAADLLSLIWPPHQDGNRGRIVDASEQNWSDISNMSE